MNDIAARLARVRAGNLREWVYHLSRDPLPNRKLNYTLPGHSRSTLEEADDWIAARLTSWGYRPELEPVRVQAFGRDLTKPLAHQYAPPPQGAPWFTAHNIYAKLEGSTYDREVIVLMAHKDSQSWIDSPGANDNAIGTAGLLEIARVLEGYRPQRAIWLLFCNEEHTPWTSVVAARGMAEAGLEVTAAINLDGIGVKPPEHAGRLINITRYTTPEGERLANLMEELNVGYGLGLEQSKHRSERPGDDDGSFINAGFAWAVLNIGSMPYGDPNYHTEGDVPELVDVANAAVTVQLTLAAVLHLDAHGRPGTA